MVTLSRLVFGLSLSLLVPAFASTAEALPRPLRPGPAPLAIDWDVSVVPRQPQRVWYAQGVFWTVEEGQWYRADRRQERWRAVATPAVPKALRKLRPADERRADALCAKAEHRKPAPVKNKPLRVKVAKVDADDEDGLRETRLRHLKSAQVQARQQDARRVTDSQTRR